MSAYPEGMVWKPVAPDKMKQYEGLVGRRFRIRPEMIEGKDGVTYAVITFLTGGRGWFARQYCVPVDADVDIVVEVRAVQSQGQFRFADVKIICGEKIAIAGTFVKNPYKRKDGTINPSFHAGFSSGDELGKRYGAMKPLNMERYNAFTKKWGGGMPTEEIKAQWKVEHNAIWEDFHTTLIEVKYLTEEVRDA